ncbi:hypothetical protein MnTg02_02382 [bacterium MnTg02]|nr:hypothetical protein MnTg02_02382 [bacterium MnTg02]
MLALPAGEPRGLQHDTIIGIYAPRLPEQFNPFIRDECGIELGEIDAAIDDAHAIVRRAMARADQVGREVGVRNDDIASGHDAVIGGFERSLIAISAMIGGDEWPARPARRKKRTPGRRPASRVNKIDLPFTNDRG